MRESCDLPSEEPFDPEAVEYLLVQILINGEHLSHARSTDDAMHELGGDDLVRFARDISELARTGDGSTLLQYGDAEAAAGRLARALVAFVAAGRLGSDDAPQRCLRLGENFERSYFESDPKSTYFGRVTPMVLAVESYLAGGVPERVSALERRFRLSLANRSGRTS